MKTLGWSVAVCAALSMIGCKTDEMPEQKPWTPSEPPQALDFTAFDEAVEAFVTAQGLEGATAVVVHRDWGVLHDGGYGAFAADRISMMASSSKMVSVGILMRLHDQGLIDIDAPIGDYLQAWGEEEKADRTVAQLLSNSAGMKGLLDDPFYVPYLCQYLEGGTLSGCAESIYTANDSADLFEPDTEFHYGGGQWQLAGGIAEHVSGMSWAELFEETYVTPCGLESSGYTNQFQSSQVAYPTYFDGDIADLPVTDNPSIEGGMYTNVQDYAQLLLMQLRGGWCEENRVLAASSVDAMQADRIGDVYGGQTPDPTFSGYGLGWWVSRNVPGLVQDAGAYGAIPWIDRERGYAALVVVESNTLVGTDLAVQVRPILDTLIDEASM